MDCVVGSGPAGVACAAALLQRGREVHMLDAGLRLEPEREQIVARLAQSPPEKWSAEDRNWLTSGMSPTARGIPEKLLFGSDHPYRPAANPPNISLDRVGLRPSFALGGLSTVWGAAMLPYPARDLVDWPINPDELAPHYKAVLELTGLSAELDDLTDLFPLFTESPGRLEMSRQAQALHRSLDRNRDRLRQEGIWFGRARVAVRANNGSQSGGCVYCGMCMYGCPYGYIYNSAATVKRMISSAKFRYQPDAVVASVHETDKEAVVGGSHRLTGERFEIRAQRVFLAAGAIPTSGILLRSLPAYDQTLRMKDSQYFLLPVMLTRRIGKVREERLHSLSQMFLELIDPRISPHTVHLQVYSFNDLIGKAIRKSFGALAGPLGFLARELENRLLLIQGFVHSAHSSEIAVTLRRGVAEGRDQLQLEAVINPGARTVVHQVVRKLARNSFRLGIVPLPMLLQIAEPGRSFHAGGAFPMRQRPSGFETDRLGRPAGWQRVHAVDATVFPSIPATTITFTIMANAHRIASEAATA
ncbi:MAG: NAD(P)-binding protein [Verrucomicrobia bacterium]|nr:NAD(P)-binding protein [Verrucomicrobiota bacterium]